jgi:hypothetical protein
LNDRAFAHDHPSGAVEPVSAAALSAQLLGDVVREHQSVFSDSTAHVFPHQSYPVGQSIAVASLGASPCVSIARDCSMTARVDSYGEYFDSYGDGNSGNMREKRPYRVALLRGEHALHLLIKHAL